jgi:hypothetical protein
VWIQSVRIQINRIPLQLEGQTYRVQGVLYWRDWRDEKSDLTANLPPMKRDWSSKLQRRILAGDARWKGFSCVVAVAKEEGRGRLEVTSAPSREPIGILVSSTNTWLTNLVLTSNYLGRPDQVSLWDTTAKKRCLGGWFFSRPPEINHGFLHHFVRKMCPHRCGPAEGTAVSA